MGDVAGMAVLEVGGLSKRYRDGTWANRDITFGVEPGEVLGILGPNGAGKTTLVRQITTELVPTSGTVRVHGRDAVSDPDSVKPMLGVVPQEANLYWGLTVFHHLRLFGRLRGLSRRDALDRTDHVIESLRLREHRDRPIEALSGGLKRRVLVGIAALARPSLMVLDEPTTGLDPESRRDVWSFIRQYRSEGTTVLLTTHYMEEAETLADRVAVIHDGRLLALDTVDGLRAAHGLEFKVTFSRTEGAAEPETMYGPNDGALVEQVRAMGVRQYAVSRASLEDVYLALTGSKERLDGGG